MLTRRGEEKKPHHYYNIYARYLRELSFIIGSSNAILFRILYARVCIIKEFFFLYIYRTGVLYGSDCRYIIICGRVRREIKFFFPPSETFYCFIVGENYGFFETILRGLYYIIPSTVFALYYSH